MKWKYIGSIKKLHNIIEKTPVYKLWHNKAGKELNTTSCSLWTEEQIQLLEYHGYVLSPNLHSYFSWQGNHPHVQQFSELCLYLAKLYIQCPKQSHLYYDIKWTDRRVKITM